MSDIFEDFVILDKGSEFVDTLGTFETLFTNLGISLLDYADDVETYSAEALYESLKKVLLLEAQNQSIIPYDWDIEDWFEFDPDHFSISLPSYSTDEDLELAKEVQNKFKDWSGIELDIE